MIPVELVLDDIRAPAPKTLGLRRSLRLKRLEGVNAVGLGLKNAMTLASGKRIAHGLTMCSGNS